MKVMLIKDVYKLGRAGDVKKVADGYGRNFLIPQGLAVLATAGALKQVERIKGQAEIRRTSLNSELKGISDQINGLVLDFVVKAGETGKLYGSITTQDVANAITVKIRFDLKRQQVDMQPVREIGEYPAHVRLTMDLVPEVKLIVHREGEVAEEEAKEEKKKPKVKKAKAEAEAPAEETPAAEAPTAEAAAE